MHARFQRYHRFTSGKTRYERPRFPIIILSLVNYRSLFGLLARRSIVSGLWIRIHAWRVGFAAGGFFRGGVVFVGDESFPP